MFEKYSSALHTYLINNSITNYISSHDDSEPFDKNRSKAIEAGTKLLLTPGVSQIYYGDEIERPLQIPEAVGDANLRSFMPWDSLDTSDIKSTLMHWQKLGQFRQRHPAVGKGKHQLIQKTPFVFSRVQKTALYSDRVVIGLGMPTGKKIIPVSSVFPNGIKVVDLYSGSVSKVMNDSVILDTEHSIVLLEVME